MKIVVAVYRDIDTALYERYITDSTTNEELDTSLDGVSTFIKETFAEIADEENYDRE